MIPWPARYPAHEGLVGPARDQGELWRLVLGLIVAATGYIALLQFYLGFVDTLIPIGEVEAGQSPGAMLGLLFSFGCLSAAVIGVTLVLHGRSLWTLIGAPWLWWRHFRLALFAVAALAVVLAILPPWRPYGTPLVPGLPVGQWLSILPFALLAVFIQTSAEELLFRGYLQQQLAARFASPWVWMLVPSILFALGHYAPAEAGDNALIIAAWSGLFGLLMADITARTGSLGAAMAIHFANNVLAMLVMSIPDNLNGLALFVLPFGMEAPDRLLPLLWVDFVLMIVTWLAVRLAFRR